MAALSDEEQERLLRRVDALYEWSHPEPHGVSTVTEVRGTGIKFSKPTRVAHTYRWAAEAVEDTRILVRKVAALQASVQSLAATQGVDPEKVEEIITKAVERSLADLRIVRGDEPGEEVGV